MMSGVLWAGLPLAFVAGELVARQRTSQQAVALSVAALGGMGVLGCALGGALPIFAGVCVVAVLAAATVLSRPPAWREPRELGRLLETALLTGICFGSADPRLVALAWVLSFVPGLRWREQASVSRRPIGLLALFAGAPLLAALWLYIQGEAHLAYPLVVIGAAVRMGVAPSSPLLLVSYDRLPLGRAAFVAAVRPSVPLILAARALAPEQVAAWAGPLQTWAALAALLVAVQGLSQRDPRRSLGAMSATQSAIVLYGLVSPGQSGVDGALIQWAGLGLSLVGIGVLMEAVEGRLGHARGRTVRGLIGPAPGLALLFLLFAATMSGFPGTSGFAGEDLILQAPADHAVLLRALLLVATALNGVTMLLLFARTFLGPLSDEARGFPQLTLRERLVVGVLATALGVLAISPQLAVAL